MNHLLIQILLTAVTAGYSVVPVIADFNRTHATNPLWDPHARFHVVWQVSSYAGAALLNLYLIWFDTASDENLLLAGGFAACMYAGFFVAVMTKSRYGGALYNENGYPPFKLRLGDYEVPLEPNLVVFSGIVTILLAPAVILVLRGMI